MYFVFLDNMSTNIRPILVHENGHIRLFFKFLKNNMFVAGLDLFKHQPNIPLTFHSQPFLS
jgi:hypothetical protein